MVYNDNFLMPINEAYFGKTQEVKDIIKQIGIIRTEELGVEPNNKFKRGRYAPTANTNPEMIKLNRMLEKMFGFKCCAVVIDQMAAPNACTLPVSMQMKSMIHNPAKMVEKTKNGYRYKDEAKYCLWINISSGLFTDGEYTDAEIAAIMFHEIGHNFAASFDGQLGGLVLMRVMFYYISAMIQVVIDIATRGDASGVIGLVGNIEFVRILKTKWNELASNIFIFKGMDVLWNCIKILYNAIATVINDIIMGLLGLNPFVMLAVALGAVANWPSQIFKLITGGYKDEQFADSFPAMYGLGPELASALAKLNNDPSPKTLSSYIFKQSPIFGQVADCFQFPLYMMSTLFDEHPQIGARFQMEMDLLEDEVNKKNVDPKMKVEMKRAINEIKDVYNKEVKVQSQDPNMAHVCTRMYQDFLMTMNKGDVKSDWFKNSKVIKNINKTDERLKNK